MALIVEDGSIVAGAEAYCSVADASTYHSNLGNAAWAALASDTVREQCLRKATAYMLGAYRQRWAGYRVGTVQTLDWPRNYVPLPDAIGGYGFSYVSNNTVPVEVKNACAELALKAATATLLDDTTQQVIREKVGPLEVEYDKYSSQNTKYSFVEALLAPYFTSASGIVHKVVR